MPHLQDIYQWRYPTQEDALDSNVQKVVDKVQNKKTVDSNKAKYKPIQATGICIYC